MDVMYDLFGVNTSGQCSGCKHFDKAMSRCKIYGQPEQLLLVTGGRITACGLYNCELLHGVGLYLLLESSRIHDGYEDDNYPDKDDTEDYYLDFDIPIID